MKVVDLGTRIGTTLSEFLRRGPRFFPTHSDFINKISLSECVGVDKDEVYRADLEGVGASFLALDLSSSEGLDALPEADFYTASKLLHHLPDKGCAEDLLRAVLHKAKRGVWLRLLSFEDDDQTGNGVFRKSGLRFGWMEKYLRYLCKDAVSLISRDVFNIELKAAKRIRHTNDFRVLPVSADSDKEEYEEVMGHKPQTKLVPPVVAEWDLFIGRKQYAD